MSVVETTSFIKKKHELAGLLTAIEAGSKDAVALLVKTMNAEEEEGVSLKVKLECANALIDLQVRIAAEISKDQLTRQVAEIKAKGLLASPGDGEPKRKPPITDFGTIQEVR